MTSNKPQNALLVVAKRPAPGKTKTRLTPPLTPAKAAGLYQCFLNDTLDLMRQLPGVQPGLVYLPPGEEEFFQGLAPDFELTLQRGDSLGERLDNATSHYLEAGCQKVVIMDSDSPTLPVEYLRQAFEFLDRETDVVIGPCDDGGYYLIGLKQPAARLFREVQMSTSNVTSDTLALAAAQGLRVRQLPPWYDVDDAASLRRLEAELGRSPDHIAAHTRRFLKRLQKPNRRAG